MSEEPRSKKAAGRGAKRATAVEAAGRVARLPIVPAAGDDGEAAAARALAGSATSPRGQSNGKLRAMPAPRAKSGAGARRPQGASAKECRSTRRAGCEACPQKDACGAVDSRPGGCALEADTFRELNTPERLPGLLADVLRAELRTFFRAKRQEAGGRAIDGEASKLAQALFKEVECYLGIVERLETKGAGGGTASAPLEVFPTLAAALAASGEGLFSEVGDAGLRERLRAAYVEAVDAEDAVLRRAVAACTGRDACATGDGTGKLCR